MSFVLCIYLFTDSASACSHKYICQCVLTFILFSQAYLFCQSVLTVIFNLVSQSYLFCQCVLTVIFILVSQSYLFYVTSWRQNRCSRIVSTWAYFQNVPPQVFIIIIWYADCDSELAIYSWWCQHPWQGWYQTYTTVSHWSDAQAKCWGLHSQLWPGGLAQLNSRSVTLSTLIRCAFCPVCMSSSLFTVLLGTVQQTDLELENFNTQG